MQFSFGRIRNAHPGNIPNKYSKYKLNNLHKLVLVGELVRGCKEHLLATVLIFKQNLKIMKLLIKPLNNEEATPRIFQNYVVNLSYAR